MASYSSSNSLELNLNLKPSYEPKTIPDILKELSEIENDSDKLSFLDGYINQHEDELKSISAFKTHLPQTLLLLMEGLNKLKEEEWNIRNGMKSENNGKPFMEFLALKRKHCDDGEATRLALAEDKYGSKGKGILMSLASPQSCNHQSKNQKEFIDFILGPNHDENPNIPLKKSNLGLSIGEIGSSSTRAACATNNGGADNNQTLNYDPNPSTQSNCRKSRRYWSTGLHATFVRALNSLGGFEVATPKKIRKLMDEKGLTNDQIKSHLQKYRLQHRAQLPAQANRAGGGMVNVQVPPNYFGYPNLPSLGSQGQHSSNREGPLN